MGVPIFHFLWDFAFADVVIPTTNQANKTATSILGNTQPLHLFKTVHFHGNAESDYTAPAYVIATSAGVGYNLGE